MGTFTNLSTHFTRDLRGRVLRSAVSSDVELRSFLCETTRIHKWGSTTRSFSVYF